MRLIILCCFMCFASNAFAQEAYRPAPAPAGKIVRMEYFIDADPGQGNGMDISVVAAQDINKKSVNISLGDVLKGIHLLNVRSMDESGIWSHNTIYLFDNFQLPGYPAKPIRSKISAAEYFIDTDPGTGNGTPIVLQNDTAVQAGFLVNLNGLSGGVHQFFIRTKDEKGEWSMTNYALFDNTTINAYRPAPAAPGPIKEIEYFIDNDPGFGSGTKITVPVSSDVAGLNVDIDISGLSEGEHIVYFRSLENPWSLSAYFPLQKGTILPVTWLYVKAVAAGVNSLIQWATGAEMNAEKFIIEYSLDGKKFMEAGEVAAKNQPSGESYSFQHKTGKIGLYFYRIRQVDKDGNFKYSKVVQIFIASATDAVKVYPNPAKEMVYVQIPDGQVVQQVSILDLHGRVLKGFSGDVLKNRPMSLSLSDLPSGPYYLRIFYKDAAITYPFMKN